MSPHKAPHQHHKAPHRRRLHGIIVALFGAALLTFGSLILVAPTAAATPGGPAVVQIGGPFSSNESPVGADPKDDKGDKAEKLGGGTAIRVIDLATDIVKCGLNLLSNSVKCKI